MDAKRLEIQWKKSVIMKRGTRKEIENCFKKKILKGWNNMVILKFCVVML